MPPNQSPLDYLRQLAYEGGWSRYGNTIPDKIKTLLDHELALWPDHPPLGARASTRSLGHPTSFRGIRLNQVCTVASACARV